MIPAITTEFGQVFAFARGRWAKYAEQIHPDLRGVGMLILQTISRNSPITATELTALLNMDKALVSRQVSKLRELELVDARSDDADRRVTLLTISAHGADTLEGLNTQLSAAYEERLAGWSDADRETLVHLLHRFNATPVTEHETPAARCARKAAGDPLSKSAQRPE